MKLKLFGIDFVDDTITFKIPHNTMERTTWKGGFAEIDLSEISDNEPSVQADARYDPVCRLCGDPLTTDEFICRGCRGTA